MVQQPLVGKGCPKIPIKTQSLAIGHPSRIAGRRIYDVPHPWTTSKCLSLSVVAFHYLNSFDIDSKKKCSFSSLNDGIDLLGAPV
jgi:hypothetical protein